MAAETDPRSKLDKLHNELINIYSKSYPEQLKDGTKWNTTMQNYGSAISALIKHNIEQHRKSIETESKGNIEKLNKCESNIAELETELKELRKRTTNTFLELVGFKESLKKAEHQLNATSEEKNALFEKMKTELDVLNDKLAEAEEKAKLAKDSDSQKVDTAKAEALKSAKEAATHLQQINKLDIKIKSIESKLESSTTTVNNLEIKVKEKKEKLKFLEETSKSLNLQIVSLQKEKSEFEDKNKILETENQNLKHQLATLVATAKALVKHDM